MATVTGPNDNLEKLRLEKEEKQKQLQLEKQTFTYEMLEQSTGYAKDLMLVLQKTVAKNTSPAEFAYFLNVCKSSGLNPLNKEIWCYKDGQGNLIVFTGRDGFLKKNKEMPSFLGMRSSEVCENDEFEIDMISGEVKHKFKAKDRGVLLGGYCIVWHKDKKDVVKWLDIEEFNLNQAKWKTSPKMMIKKCAESHALKEACGMTGIQAEEGFVVKNGVASSIVPSSEVSNDEKTVNKEEERLMLLIEGAPTLDELKKLAVHCISEESLEAYNDKLKTFA